MAERPIRYRLAAGAWALALAANAAADSPWILVDTRARTLTVLRGENQVLAQFPGVALGSEGTTRERRRGDAKTPLGTFHVAWINYNSRFNVFFGLDFPSIDDADRAFRQHRIDRSDYDAIVDAFLNRRVPPQGTPLGGSIGIHGLGAGNPAVHRAVDWTDGCIALTNGQVHSLARWLRIGTEVVIR
jgi:murein L,D-transpeptidase YafK